MMLWVCLALVVSVLAVWGWCVRFGASWARDALERYACGDDQLPFMGVHLCGVPRDRLEQVLAGLRSGWVYNFAQFFRCYWRGFSFSAWLPRFVRQFLDHAAWLGALGYATRLAKES